MKKDLENKHKLLNLVQNNITQGKVRGPRHLMDNYCFSMNGEEDDLIKNESYAPYIPKPQPSSKNVSQHLDALQDEAGNDQNKDNSRVVVGVYQS